MIIAVCNQKGGVGKTTAATNLAHTISQLTHETPLLIDLDPQGNSTSTLGVELHPNDLTMNDVLAAMAQGFDPHNAYISAVKTDIKDWVSIFFPLIGCLLHENLILILVVKHD